MPDCYREKEGCSCTQAYCIAWVQECSLKHGRCKSTSCIKCEFDKPHCRFMER